MYSTEVYVHLYSWIHNRKVQFYICTSMWNFYLLQTFVSWSSWSRPASYKVHYFIKVPKFSLTEVLEISIIRFTIIYLTDSNEPCAK